MNKIKTLLAACLLLSTWGANAALINNGNTTIDDATSLEWLDLTLTVGQSYNSIVGGFGGYAAQGFVHATTDQLCGLYESLGDSMPGCTSTSGFVANPLSDDNATTFTQLLGITFLQPHIHRILTWGLFDGGLITSNSRVGIGIIDLGMEPMFPSNTPAARRTLSAANLYDDFSIIGSFLVRSTSVPEPSILALMILGLASLGFARRRRDRQS